MARTTQTYEFTYAGRSFSMELHEGNEQMAVHQQKEGGFFEHEALDYIAEHYPAHGTILDIGANVGNHAVYFGSFLRADRIIAFEPHYANFALLLENTASLQNCVCLQLALGPTLGQSFVTTDAYNMGMCRVVDKETTMSFRVGVGTVDTFGFQRVTLIKIDTEGSEMGILDGARETILRCRPLIMIEMHPDNLVKYDLCLSLIGYEMERHWPDKIVALYRPRGNT